MAEKKKTNPLVFVGIGCLVLIVLMSIGTFFVGKFFASKIAGGALEKVIENKTGVSVDVGNGKMPDNFPKDFPIYSQATVTSSLSGGANESGKGFWLTLTTPDTLEQVASYYKTALPGNGWTVTANYSAGGTQTETITKGTMSGTVSLVRESDAKETQIVIVLGEESK